MNLSEFKAWFDGFTERMDGQPNKKEWARIKERVAEITKDATPSPVYLDRYVQPYRYYEGFWCETMMPTGASRIADDAFYETGKAEFLSLLPEGARA